MRYGSVCSGIEAASVAWEPLGWKPSWFSEIEPFPSAVLGHHWPNVPNLGDMLALPDRIASGEIEAPDVLVGGTPCQSFSVAGARLGLEDERGQLAIKFIELANAIDDQRRKDNEQPCIVVWENVPGVLSSKDNAFGAFLGLLCGEDTELEPPGKRWENAGYVHGPERSIAWRTLNAEYFGLAQRRRRVFVVASARADFNPFEVLFESEGVRRDTPPSREAGQGFATDIVPSLTASGRGVERIGETRGQDPVVAVPGYSSTGDGYWREGIGPLRAREQDSHENLAAIPYQEVSHCLNAGGMGRIDYETESFVVHGTQDPIVSHAHAHTLGRNSGQENAVFCFAENSRAEARLEGGDGSRTGALSTGGGKAGQGSPAVCQGLSVRRLTPIECERLQGFPDCHTLIPTAKRKRLQELELQYLRIHRPDLTEDEAKKLAADGPRYKAIGNSMAVACMRWIGERIENHGRQS